MCRVRVRSMVRVRVRARSMVRVSHGVPQSRMERKSSELSKVLNLSCV